MGRKKLSPEHKWHEQAEAFKREAEKLPYGREREELLLRARRLETASHIDKWISSPADVRPASGWWPENRLRLGEPWRAVCRHIPAG